MSCNCCNYDENILLPKEAEVVDITKMTETENLFRLRLKDGSIMKYEPGQILEVGLFGYGEIPLGFASSPTYTEKSGVFEIVVREVGKVSKALCSLKKGDTLTVRGPLGHGFPVDEFINNHVLIVAGGIGLCPTRSMIKYILDNRVDFGEFFLFFGSKTPKDQLFQDDLAEWRLGQGMKYLETVDKPDENWKGRVGVITTLFEEITLPEDTKVIICGPPVMYKFVIRELQKFNIPLSNVFVDLERRMKCGIGKCGHCQINDKYVCLDGPVFRFSEIKDLEEAI